jgi:hypothetical protein
VTTSVLRCCRLLVGCTSDAVVGSTHVVVDDVTGDGGRGQCEEESDLHVGSLIVYRV